MSNKYNFSYIIIFFISAISYVQAQDSIRLNNHFLFEDGIYFEAQNFLSNQPDIPWDDVIARVYLNPIERIAKVEYMHTKASHDSTTTLSPPLIVYQGKPYIKSLSKENFTLYSGFEFLGALTYFSYEEVTRKTYQMSAYNPYNGRAFRTGSVEREHKHLVEKIYDMRSGKTYDFNYDNFIQLIKNDKKLLATYQVLPLEEAVLKIKKGLQIYNDRNAVYISKH